eukprot:TRINITY_DN6011_c0_g1_i13.p1 TRINITY_DN6011_c0_g1~~TRINITY_DN6011_c0_g1_i13.p1  ORF type:complete len:291 (-),score=83.65 TRINITY_DN6011_c0_g1_i13:50-922(-)
MGICSSSEACKTEAGLEFNDNLALDFTSSRRNDIPTYNINGNGERGIRVSKEFLTNLPSAKVLLVSSKSKRSADEPEEATPKVPRLLYDLPDDFCVPKELCLNQEEGLLLNKTTIRLFADYMLDDNKGFTNYKDDADVKVWLKKGNDLYEEHLVVKSVYTLDDDISVDKMVEVLRDVDSRTKWDNGQRETKSIRKFSDCFITFRNVAPMPIIQNRDFVEKMIIFQHNGAYYIYYSSIPDKFCPKRSGYTRGYTMYAVNRIKREGNKTIVRTSTHVPVSYTHLTLPTTPYV